MYGMNFKFNISLGHKSQEVLLDEIRRGALLVSEFEKKVKEKNGGFCPDCGITFNFFEGEPGGSEYKGGQHVTE